MTVADGAKDLQIFTIGHSNHSWEAFLGLLQEHSIKVIVDVRSSPYSRYTPHFTKGPLSQALPPVGIGYLFMGDRLGGHPESSEFYDSDGRVCYDRLADSPDFKKGIDQLLKNISSCRIALMCGEEDPAHCHRRLLIARVLRHFGLDVWHIRGDGQVQTEAELAALEAMPQHRQMSLFDPEDVRPWKSTQSVSPKKVPKNSLKS